MFLITISILFTTIVFTYNYRYTIIKKLFTLVPKNLLLEFLNNFLENQPQQTSNFVKINDQCAKISYNYGNKVYNLYVPFSRKNSCRNLETKVTVVNDTETLDITQQPGMPYFITSKNFPGSKIYVTMSGTSTEYTEDTKIIF